MPTGRKRSGFALWDREKLRGAALKWGVGRRYKRQPTQVKTLTLTERVWLGAMIEAEGHVGFYNGAWRIGVGNTDLEVISAFLRCTGVGNVTVRFPPGCRTAWTWASERYNDVRSLAHQLAPFCMKVRKILDADSSL